MRTPCLILRALPRGDREVIHDMMAKVLFELLPHAQHPTVRILEQ